MDVIITNLTFICHENNFIVSNKSTNIWLQVFFLTTLSLWAIVTRIFPWLACFACTSCLTSWNPFCYLPNNTTVATDTNTKLNTYSVSIDCDLYLHYNNINFITVQPFCMRKENIFKSELEYILIILSTAVTIYKR